MCSARFVHFSYSLRSRFVLFWANYCKRVSVLCRSIRLNMFRLYMLNIGFGYYYNIYILLIQEWRGKTVLRCALFADYFRFDQTPTIFRFTVPFNRYRSRKSHCGEHFTFSLFIWIPISTAQGYFKCQLKSFE